MTTETIVLLAWGGIALLVFWIWGFVETRKTTEDQGDDAPAALFCAVIWPFIVVLLVCGAVLFGPPMLVAKLFKRKSPQSAPSEGKE